MADVNGQWWYEKNGAQAGPVAFAVLQQLAALGELKRSTLVWTVGMTGWARAESVPGLTWSAAAAVPADTEPAPAPAPGAPPPVFGGSGAGPAPSQLGGGASQPGGAPSQPSGAPTPGGGATASGWGFPPSTAPVGSAAEAVQGVEEINVVPTIVLSVVTLTIYGMVKFFQTGKAYERLVGRETRFTTWFWVFVATLAAAALMNASGSRMGVLLSLAAVVFQFLTLGEALKNRAEGLRRWGLAVPVTSDTTHYVLLALGILFAPIFVGLVLLAVQAVKWFKDWNAIRAAALMRPRQATAVRA